MPRHIERRHSSTSYSFVSTASLLPPVSPIRRSLPLSPRLRRVSRACLVLSLASEPIDQSSPGMSAKCLKILVLLSLIPLALRATSLLGHVMPLPSESQRSTSSSSGSSISMMSVSASAHSGYYRRHRRRMESTLAAFGTTRFRRGGGGGFDDEKRLEPTGSNPLHNLR